MLKNLVPDFLQVALESFSDESFSGRLAMKAGGVDRFLTFFCKSGPKTKTGFLELFGRVFRTLKVVGPQAMVSFCVEEVLSEFRFSR